MSTAELERAVSLALVRVHLMERALHDPGPWEIELGDVRVLARRTIREDGVVLAGHFSTAPRKLGIVADTMTLFCHGEAVACRPAVEIPEEGEFEVLWSMTVPTSWVR
jgi:hypothetical protein